MPSTSQEFASKLASVIINPLLALMFGVALAVFIWGIVEFLMALSEGGDTATGKQHMLWGIVGLFIMASAYGILQIATNTFGISVPH